MKKKSAKNDAVSESKDMKEHADNEQRDEERELRRKRALLTAKNIRGPIS